jgi:hypothetical protein
VKRVVIAGILTVGLVLWAHQLHGIGARVPMVFVALWFGSTAMVALVFAIEGGELQSAESRNHDSGREQLWRGKLRLTLLCLLPLVLVPLLETRGVGNDPAIWLLDCALFISMCCVPYFIGVARSVLGGVVLSIGAFQALWTCGASICFVIMKHMEAVKGRALPHGGTFEDFFRLDYRYLFYVLCAAMVLVYCPAILWLGHRRFVRGEAPSGIRLLRALPTAEQI